jgi:hypothetical protein
VGQGFRPAAGLLPGVLDATLNTRRLGATEYDLLIVYPSLRAEDLANAWVYVRSHSSEIDAQIRDNEAA